MNPDVIQFQCSACQSVLTVPSHMAGVSGPCPICGQTVCSPAPVPTTPAAPEFFAMPPSAPASLAEPVTPMPQSSWDTSGAMAQAALGTAALPPQSSGFGGQHAGFTNPMPGLDPVPAAPAPTPFPQAPAWGQFPTPTAQPPEPAHFPPVAPQGFPEAPPAAALSHAPAVASSSGSFLPPRRSEGQAPQVGAVVAPSTPWGASLEPREMPPHEGGLGGTLGFSQSALSSAPLQNPSPLNGPLQGQPSEVTFGRETPTAPVFPISRASLSGTQPRSSSGKSAYQRPSQRRSRGSPVFILGIALLFLAGFLAAAGYLFREPLMVVVHRFFPSTTSDATVDTPVTKAPAEALPETKDSPVTATTAAKAPAVAVPSASATAKPTTEDLAMKPTGPTESVLPATRPALSAKEEEPPSALPSATGVAAPVTETLVEIPPKAVMPDVREGGAKSRSVVSGSGPLVHVAEDIPVADQEEARVAAADLQKFLSAKNLAERLECTLASDQMKPLMERYYSVNPDGPVAVDSIGFVRLDRNPQVGGGPHALFGIESKKWEFPIPVMLEASPSGYRVDWLSFVEFKDRVLEKFFQGYQPGRARFHVGITRQHYFGDDVPDGGGKEAFRVSTAPPNPFLTTVFLDKASALSHELREQIPWGAQVWAIVELEWAKVGTQQWVELAAVPQLNWYSVPTAPKALAETPQASAGPSQPTPKGPAVKTPNGTLPLPSGR